MTAYRVRLAFLASISASKAQSCRRCTHQNGRLASRSIAGLHRHMLTALSCSFAAMPLVYIVGPGRNRSSRRRMRTAGGRPSVKEKRKKTKNSRTIIIRKERAKITYHFILQAFSDTSSPCLVDDRYQECREEVFSLMFWGEVMRRCHVVGGKASKERKQKHHGYRYQEKELWGWRQRRQNQWQHEEDRH